MIVLPFGSLIWKVHVSQMQEKGRRGKHDYSLISMSPLLPFGRLSLFISKVQVYYTIITYKKKLDLSGA